jgi:hypothetical protein
MGTSPKKSIKKKELKIVNVQVYWLMNDEGVGNGVDY